MTTITRIGYCPVCAKNGSPKSLQRFYAQGASHRDPFIEHAHRNGKAGMTPHLYKITGYDNVRNKVYFQRLCCMEGCGSYDNDDEKYESLLLDEGKWSTVMVMHLRDWNALQKFKDTGYRV